MHAMTGGRERRKKGLFLCLGSAAAAEWVVRECPEIFLTSWELCAQKKEQPNPDIIRYDVPTQAREEGCLLVELRRYGRMVRTAQPPSSINSPAHFIRLLCCHTILMIAGQTYSTFPSFAPMATSGLFLRKKIGRMKEECHQEEK